MISENNLEAVLDAVEKLNKKARKLGCSETVLAVRGWIDVNLGSNEIDRRYHIDAIGEAPRYDGWTFVAKLQKPEGCMSSIIFAIPGQEVPKRFRTSDPSTCEHCGIRRHRKATYVVRHDSGEYKQVGSSCMKDFLGHSNPENLIKNVDLFAGIEGLLDEYDGFYHVRPMWRLETFLAYTVMYVREGGWISRSSAIDMCIPATADCVVEALQPPRSGEKEKPRPTEHDFETAQKVIEYLPRLFAEKTNDYLYNLKVATESAIVTCETAGIVASAVACYNKHIKIENAKKDHKPSEHVGNVKERFTFEAQLIGQNFFDGVYGTTHLMRFRDKDDNIFVWFSSRCADVELEENYKITATVKKHDEYKGTKQTVITRAKLKELA